MRIAIVYPEVYDIARFGKKRKEFPPFGVLYLATIVSAINGMRVEVFSVEPDQAFLDFTGFDVVAFSIPSSVTYDTVKRMRFGGLYSDNTLMIAGGVHATIFPKQTLINLKMDAVCIGNGEEAIVELLEEREMRQFFSYQGHLLYGWR